VRRGAGWVPLEATLRRNADGTASPAATPDDLVLSGGGAGPLATMSESGWSASLAWPGPLPAPALSGDTAIYSNVLPGVDLSVRADAEGFSEQLLVRSRSAAADPGLAGVRFGLAATGLTFRATGDGGLAGVDAAGASVVTVPAPSMWDAADHPARAPVGMTLAGGQLVLRPDISLLTAATTRFPVTIDPSFTAGQLNWTVVHGNYPNTAFWNGNGLTPDSNGNAMVGDDPFWLTPARSFFQMNTSAINGKHILGATFRVPEGWSSSCSAREVDLWETGGISTSTTWNNQPSWMHMEASASVAYGHSSSCPANTVAFNATAPVRDAASSGWPNLTLGLRAANEGDTIAWKRFQPNASLAVDYNTVPSVGTRSTVPAMTCVSGTSGQPAANDPLINTATPTLRAVAIDADTADNNETGHFAWQSWNGSAWVASGSAADPILRAANTVTQVTTPSLADSTYRWQVQISQPVMSPYSGTDSSAWSQWCEFRVDTTPPPAPSVSSAQYPSGCAPCGGVGTTGTFTFTGGAPDVATYFWGTSDPPATQVNPSGPGGSVTVQWTPASGGPATLFVASRDAAGNRSAETRYQFTVDAPAPLLAHWRLDETSGTALADDTGHGNTATLAGGTLGAPSRIVGAPALALNGTPLQFAQAAGPVLDTSRSFSVAAWVKLETGTQYASVLGQLGVHSSGFQLQYDPTCTCWNFVLPVFDGTNPGAAVVHSPTSAVSVGTWTHLAAVYDSGASTATLYVDGTAVGTVPGPATPWNAPGAFVIGETRWNDVNGGYFLGSISGVGVWQRVLFPSEVRAMVDPTGNPVGEYHFDEVGSSIAFDSSNYANDLTLQGDAQIPAAGAGYQGTGMLLMDGGGWATSAGQVLHTDQSFTVSAWVRIDGSSLPTWNLTALGQEGTQLSAFYLGYRVVSGVPRWSFSMSGGDVAGGPGWVDAPSSTALTTSALGQWTQLTGVFDASTNTMRLYVDGALAGTASRTTAPWDATGALTVGAALWTAQGGQPALVDDWIGAIDEVRILPGAVIQALDAWTFDSCTGTPVACPDGGTGSHPITLASGATWSSNGHTGDGLAFDGTGGASTTGVPAIDTTASFTVAAWVNLSSLPAGDAVAVAQRGTNQDFFELGYRGDIGQWCLTAYAADSGTAARTSACAGAPATAGTWTHLTGEYDAVAGQLRLYVNGSLAGTAPVTTRWAATGELLLGRGWRSGAAAAFSTGLIDNVEVFSGDLDDPSSIT
jgi:hypothetical protein